MKLSRWKSVVAKQVPFKGHWQQTQSAIWWTVFCDMLSMKYFAHLVIFCSEDYIHLRSIFDRVILLLLSL